MNIPILDVIQDYLMNYTRVLAYKSSRKGRHMLPFFIK